MHGSNLALETTPQTGRVWCSNREGASEASDALGLGRSNFGPLWQIRVQTKPSKQPLGLVTCGVPIEKVQAKRAMHSDWAHGAAGAPKGHLGRSNFGQGHVFMVRTKPSKQPLGLVAHGVPIEKVRAKRAMHSDWARGVAGAWSRRRREAAPGVVQLQTWP